MTLSFQQQIAGEPNYFIEKIWASIDGTLSYYEAREFYEADNPYELFADWHFELFDKQWDIPVNQVKPKLHSIRKGNRWKIGDKIHFVINNRTKNRFQFAPVAKCKSVQSIEIKRFQKPTGDFSYPDEYGAFCLVCIGGTYLKKNQIEQLAINDGFNNGKDFFRYFNSHFVGQIIHWTDLKY